MKRFYRAKETTNQRRRQPYRIGEKRKKRERIKEVLRELSKVLKKNRTGNETKMLCDSNVTKMPSRYPKGGVQYSFYSCQGHGHACLGLGFTPSSWGSSPHHL